MFTDEGRGEEAVYLTYSNYKWYWIRHMGQNNHAEPAHFFQNRLKNVRIAKGFSQAELAAKSGITTSCLCH